MLLLISYDFGQVFSATYAANAVANLVPGRASGQRGGGLFSWRRFQGNGSSSTLTSGASWTTAQDPNGWNYLTSYQYDALDNLVGVTQGTQTRSFVYNSLKQLLSATNHESGTISNK